jgi:hypothetical protein
MQGYEEVYSFCPRCKQLKPNVGAQTIPGEPGAMRLMCGDCRDDVIKRGQAQHTTPEWSPAYAIEHARQDEEALQRAAEEAAARRAAVEEAAKPAEPADQSLKEALEEFIPAMWGALAALQRKLQGKEK